jgi:hypothetical protein
MYIKVIMEMKIMMKNILNKLPYVRGLYQQSLNCRYPNGHYYSPVCLINDIKERELAIWKNRDVEGIQGIKLRTNEQIKLVEQFTKYYNEIPFKDEKQLGIRYNFINNYYSYTDCIILYSMIRHFKPNRIIEIGSGYSSAIMLDVNELFFDNQMNLIFIDPYPERLFSLITENDELKTTIIESDVQLVSLEVFSALEPGDILFVDSTHVSKTGSDVNYILFEILPILKKGVLIHFHDIFYPFEYPKEWAFKGFNWNECYLLKAFLMNNDKFEIRLFADYLHLHHKNSFSDLPLCYRNYGGNLWIEKIN